MTLRVTSWPNSSSDQVKQSIDSLEKYSLFTENKLKLFVHKEFDQCGSLLRKIMLKGECIVYSHNNCGGKKQPCSVF